ncbi:unnamed protein product [Blepharisma stoltei]|uniref:BZIP domain-containing protein n=1 Tax=Blepharisma stoltei TaxID=1481888 RepID=A0AAU9IQA4_9CILI|nr:unnamed protein product [Blepharisma stoltei]
MEPEIQNTVEKRQRRLAKNKESARKSRKRKKHYIDFLEKKVNALSQEADRLRQQLYKKPNIHGNNHELRNALIHGENIKDTIESIQEKLSQSCSQRKEHIQFLVDEVLDVMIPNHAKLLLVMCQNPDIEVPELTPEQISSIKQLQPDLAQEQAKLKEVVGELKQVKEEMSELLDWGGKIPQEMCEYLTNEQVAEILLSLESENVGI